ncbi:hypothetical protein [Ammoniphilus sp. YIM 78166]|uniref:hypothetical protein n=1 Tax=Ammoniphilus sp. YIM 78166 TaxID=1644106 RepID=UPI0010706782|nr:hypothetical protein [Ammoniphilus sp. YIM 78166]
MALHGASFKITDEIPPEIIEQLMNDHHMSWLSLSSSFRLQEDATPTYRQPDFSSWIHMD